MEAHSNEVQSNLNTHQREVISIFDKILTVIVTI